MRLQHPSLRVVRALALALILASASGARATVICDAGAGLEVSSPAPATQMGQSVVLSVCVRNASRGPDGPLPARLSGTTRVWLACEPGAQEGCTPVAPPPLRFERCLVAPGIASCQLDPGDASGNTVRIEMPAGGLALTADDVTCFAEITATYSGAGSYVTIADTGPDELVPDSVACEFRGRAGASAWIASDGEICAPAIPAMGLLAAEQTHELGDDVDFDIAPEAGFRFPTRMRLRLACDTTGCEQPLPGILEVPDPLTPQACRAISMPYLCSRDPDDPTGNTVRIDGPLQDFGILPTSRVAVEARLVSLSESGDYVSSLWMERRLKSDFDDPEPECLPRVASNATRSVAMRGLPRIGEILIVDGDADSLLRLDTRTETSDVGFVLKTAEPEGFDDPTDVAIDGDGSLLVSNVANPNLPDGVVRRFDAFGVELESLLPHPDDPSTLQRPTALERVGDDIYVADAGFSKGGPNGRILRLEPALRGGRVRWRQRVVLDAGTLLEPLDMAGDARGALWIVDRGEVDGAGGLVYRLDPATGVATPIPGPGGAWERPRGVAVDRDDTVVVFDSGFAVERVVRLDAVTGQEIESCSLSNLDAPLRVDRILLTPLGDLLVTRLAPNQNELARILLIPSDPVCLTREIAAYGEPIAAASALAVVPNLVDRDIVVAEPAGTEPGRVLRVRAGEADAPLGDESLEDPVGVLVDGAGGVVVLDQGSREIRSIDPELEASKLVSRARCMVEPEAIASGERGQLLVFDTESACTGDTITVDPRTGEQSEDPGVIVNECVALGLFRRPVDAAQGETEGYVVRDTLLLDERAFADGPAVIRLTRDFEQSFYSTAGDWVEPFRLTYSDDGTTYVADRRAAGGAPAILSIAPGGGTATLYSTDPALAGLADIAWLEGRLVAATATQVLEVDATGANPVLTYPDSGSRPLALSADLNACGHGDTPPFRNGFVLLDSNPARLSGRTLISCAYWVDEPGASTLEVQTEFADFGLGRAVDIHSLAPYPPQAPAGYLVLDELAPAVREIRESALVEESIEATAGGAMERPTGMHVNGFGTYVLADPSVGTALCRCIFQPPLPPERICGDRLESFADGRDPASEAEVELAAAAPASDEPLLAGIAMPPPLAAGPPDGVFCDPASGDFLKVRGTRITVQPEACLAGRSVNQIPEIELAPGFPGFQNLLFVVTNRLGDIFATDFGAGVVWRLPRLPGDRQWGAPEAFFDADALSAITGQPEGFAPLGICVFESGGTINVADKSPVDSGGSVRIVQIASRTGAAVLPTEAMQAGGIHCVDEPVVGRRERSLLDALDLHPLDPASPPGAACPGGDGELGRDDAEVALRVALGLLPDLGCPDGPLDLSRLDVAPPAHVDTGQSPPRIEAGADGAISGADALLLHRSVRGLSELAPGTR